MRCYLSAVASNKSVSVNLASCDSLVTRYHSAHIVGEGAADRAGNGTEVSATVADKDREKSAVVGSLLIINTIKFIRCEGSVSII